MALPAWLFVRRLPLPSLLLLLLLSCTSSVCDDVPKEVRNLYGLHGWVKSPGYPGQYPDEARYEWHISVPRGYVARLKFAHFHVEMSANCEYDFVKVSADNETLGIFCGQGSQGEEFAPGKRFIEAPGNRINVIFHSDFSNEERFTGFKAYFTALDINECEAYAGIDELACQHNCHNYPGGFECSCHYGYILGKDGHTCTVECSGIVFTERQGVITSPEYPNPYPRALQCKFTLRLEEGFVFNLAFQEIFDVETHPEVNNCPYDSLTIVSGSQQWGPLCGKELPNAIETTNSVVEIIFTSDKSGDHTGWKIHYTSKGFSCLLVDVPPDGLVMPKQGSYSFTDRIVVLCNTGYRLIQGENGEEAHALQTTCLKNGTWDRMFPTCEIVDCRSPPHPKNGIYSLDDNKTTYKGKVTFRCREAYHLTVATDDVFTCNESGRWTNPHYGEKFPKCQPVCGQPKAFAQGVARVIGGENAAAGTFPWQAIIKLYSHNSMLKGGGSLIDERWILTAAHVVDNYLLSEIFITLGTIMQQTKDEDSLQRFTVDKVIMHPGYNYTKTFYDNDIALLRLAGAPANMTDTVRPICLPIVTEGGVLPELTPEFEGFVSGWGRTKGADGSPSARVLQYVQLPIVEQSICVRTNDNKLYHGQITSVTENMFCAGFPDGGKDSCQGDSGGPFSLVHDNTWYLTGIVSWGMKCAQPNQYGVYTRVDKYLDWVHSEIAKHD